MWFSRTELLAGKENINKLKDANVMVVGLGGVGSFAAELICRAGVGNMTIVDGDKVEESNRNRQLPALVSTTGRKKAEIMHQRLMDINPELNLRSISDFITEEAMADLVSERFDYVVDAIDTLAPKVNLIYNCVKNSIPIVSSMGAGGKYNPELIKIVDISKSYNCTLARQLRKRLYRLGINKGVKVVFSPEEIVKESVIKVQQQNKKTTVGTISFMPPVFGCYCASVVVNYLLFGKDKSAAVKNTDSMENTLDGQIAGSIINTDIELK